MNSGGLRNLASLEGWLHTGVYVFAFPNGFLHLFFLFSGVAPLPTVSTLPVWLRGYKGVDGGGLLNARRIRRLICKCDTCAREYRERQIYKEGELCHGMAMLAARPMPTRSIES